MQGKKFNFEHVKLHPPIFPQKLLVKFQRFMAVAMSSISCILQTSPQAATCEALGMVCFLVEFQTYMPPLSFSKEC